ncbi:MAG: ribosome maturation factor RimP, partial [Rhodothermales bacterium]|nr:ribosome maturation factor RimP [Rhodothermales bacterium]
MSTHPVAEPLHDRVQALVEDILSGTAHFVVEVEVRGKPGSQSVSVYLDSDDALGVDELARISRELGFLLDTED